jgi:uncharacterized protein
MAQDRVIDMDGHITEPVDLWLRYVDAPYRDMAPRIVQATSGADVVAFMGSEHVPAYPIGLPGAGMAGQRVGPRTMFERRYVDGHRGGFDPSARLEVMDAEGIDAVLPHYDAVFPGAVQTFVSNCGLDSDGRRAILSGNAARLLGID